MSSLRGSMAEKYFAPAFPQLAASSSRSITVKEIYPQFVPRNRQDYPRAVDEDSDLDASVVQAIPTITSRQGALSTEDNFDVLDDETFGRCHVIFCEPNESVQYFNDEDLFGRLLNSDSDSEYFQQGGDYEKGEQLLEETDMLFDNDWDSDDTVTNPRLLVLRGRVYPEELVLANVALRERTIHTAIDDGAQYFDADDLFEREEADSTSVYGRDEEIRWYSED